MAIKSHLLVFGLVPSRGYSMIQHKLGALLFAFFIVEYASSDCFSAPTIRALMESAAPFGTRELVIRATLLEQQTNISCPVNVYISDYVETAEGFGMLQVEEVFRGNASAGDELTFVYSTDTGYRQILPVPLGEAAKSLDGILLFLSQKFVSCANDTEIAPDGLFSINECDFGNGIPFDGWSGVSNDDKDYLRSFMATKETTPANQPTRSTLSPTLSPVSSASAIGTAMSFSSLVIAMNW